MRNKTGIFLVVFLMAALFSVRGIYFPSCYFQIPIDSLNSYQIPCTSIEIQGNRYSVEIDLGAKAPLSIDTTVLAELKKMPCGTSRRMDFHGHKYATNSYFLPEVKLGALVLKNLKAREESEKFASKDSLIFGANERNINGRIGRDFFSGKNIFMDFKHLKMVACRRLGDLKRDGYKTNQFTPVPFKVTPDGITFEVETDYGKKKFVLDSGTTVTILRSENLEICATAERYGMPVIETRKFAFSGIDFGPRELYIVAISHEFNEMDGLLGMDFLKEHLVYLDFETQTSYIGTSADKAESDIGEQKF